MGADAGFDMVPRLSKDAADRRKWEQFIDSIKRRYEDDTQVEIKPNYILFKAGEHPTLPFEGHKFLRFSSKITGPNTAATGVERYIRTVRSIADSHFGSRIQYWDELFDVYGEYDWAAVDESIRSYEQPDEPEAHSGIDTSVRDPTSLFEVKDIPGKGRGLVACVDIASGTRILCEEPIFTSLNLSSVDLERNIAAKLKALSKTSQRQFLSLHNNFPGKFPFSNTFKTNALPCGADSPIGAVYPTICLINHSCISNSHHSWNSLLKKETIHATRPIAAGDEITISYDGGNTSDLRRKQLKEAFGFECDCARCSCSAADLQASNARRMRIKTLDDAIGDAFCMSLKPGQSLRACQSLLKVLSDEFEQCAGVLNARLYYDAFQICVAHGDQARARVFAERSWASRVHCEGEDSPEALRVQSLAREPAAHPSFELCSKRWRTKKGMAPKGLNAEKFELAAGVPDHDSCLLYRQDLYTRCLYCVDTAWRWTSSATTPQIINEARFSVDGGQRGAGQVVQG
ncbi:hypothetical protein C7974DRAFT_29811 [Boeremia exigua]|uniref:uncharacterized protein n=1 Tax=Boeremia exigua TaxID=749465 RepID=UPI001E8D9D14|nr:uncharacterized protein C7974DRAFT_29811 [Boeremia exigua]KAH6644880.1 hypothetical protein C7974DRAFT_29811 [Boeremia exigua]